MNDLKELRDASGVSGKEMVAEVQRLFPRFDKTTLSKCIGEGYGIQLDPDAMKMLYERFAPDLLLVKQRRKKDHHRMTDRITCRFKKVEYAALQQAAEASGLTIQQMVRGLVVSALIDSQWLSSDGKELTP